MQEHRLPHVHFAKTLARICERLDACHRAVLDAPRYNQAPLPVTVCIDEVWAVGSFAQGLAQCGDLDLVVTLRCTKDTAGLVTTGYSPKKSTISRKFFGAPADMRFYTGTCDENSSGVAFDVRRKVWDAKDPRWRERLDAITVDPLAKRFARPSDIIPLRFEQYRYQDEESLGNKWFEDFARACANDVYRCSFVAFEAHAREIDPEHALTHDAIREVLDRGNKRVRALLPQVVQSSDKILSGTDKRLDWQDFDWDLRRGATLFQMDELFVTTRPLDTLGAARVAFSPAPSRRGPNGIMLIARGENHPLVQLAQNLTLYHPIRHEHGLEARRLDLDWESVPWNVSSYCSRPRDASETASITGRALLDAVSASDMVRFDGKRYFRHKKAEGFYVDARRRAKASGRYFDRLLLDWNHKADAHTPLPA